jgi:hypothetical protein
VDETRFLQHPEHVLNVHGSKCVVARKRQLERGTFDVLDEDVQVIRIDQCVFR